MRSCVDGCLTKFTCLLTSAVTILLLRISIDISSIFSKYRDIDRYRYPQSVMPIAPAAAMVVNA